MRKIFLSATILLAMASAAHAGVCEGTVYGLSSHYNPATGSGFLAVRAGPHSSATQTGELFNGDAIEIDDHKGSWYLVSNQNVSGWANQRWIATQCNW